MYWLRGEPLDLAEAGPSRLFAEGHACDWNNAMHGVGI